MSANDYTPKEQIMTDITSISGVSDGFSEHYTPTTEEVRDNYAPPRTEIADSEAQFDRWLTELKAEVWHEGMMSVKKHVSCWPKQDKLPVNPYIPEIGKTPQHFPETGNNV